MTDFLSIPCKKASEVDLVKPLKNLIQSLYSTSDRPADFTSALSELNKNRAQAVSKNLDKSLPALEVLYRYYDQISALEAKIPAHEINIPFKWKDAFDEGSLLHRVSLTVASLGFEKVGILFNIAAIQSQVAAQGRISDTDEELKTAAKLFQSSAGIFNQLKSAAAVMGGQEPTPDLHPETLSALSALMLAQAQEMFVQKAIQDKMKDGIIAKLCAQAEDLYADALRQLQKDTLLYLWPKDWIPTVSGKQTAYAGIANYFQACVCATNKKVGEQITRLNHCIDTLKTAQQRSGKSSFFTDYQNKATRLRDEAKKDNDFIYHERIPEISSLVPVEKPASARLAKPLPLADRLSHNFKDLFDELVPVALHQAMQSCDVRKSEMTNSRVNQLREATQLLNSILASLNLPHALEDQGSASDVPHSLVEKSKAVTDAGGVQALSNMINEMPTLVQRNKEILDEAERMLREEEESDNQLRAQLKEKWTRTPSSKLNGTFKSNAERYRTIINNANTADETVRTKFNTHLKALNILSQGEAGLASSLPKDGASKAHGSASAKDALKKLMAEVDALRNERDQLETQIKNLTFDLKTPFLQALAQDGAINEPVLSTQLIGQAFNPLEQRVKENLEKQEKLIVGIQENSDEYFGRSPSGSQAATEREQMMRQLAEAYDAFLELQNNVKEGTKFYNDLTQLLVAYQNKISDFCFARKTEKEELLKDVTRNASTTAPVQTMPPARPPPPAVQPQVPAPAQPPHPQAPNPYAPSAAPPAYNPNVPYPTYPTMPMPYSTQATPYPIAYGAPLPPYNPYGTYPPPAHGHGGYPPYQQPPGGYGAPQYPYPPQQPPPQ